MTHESVLTWLLLGWCAASLAAAILTLRRAPAVSLALIGWVIGGLGGFAIARTHSARGVPQTVALGACVGIVLLGLIGLVVTRPLPPARAFRLGALAIAAATPVVAAALTWSLLYACPLYVHGGYCHHDVDVLGSWISAVASGFLGSAIWLLIVLLVSAEQIRRSIDERQTFNPSLLRDIGI